MEESMSKIKPLWKRLSYVAIIVFGILLDQLTKMLAVKYLKPIASVPLWKNVLHLTYVENRGAAFGMLADHRWVFMLFSSVAIVALAFYLFWDRSYLSDKGEDGRYPAIFYPTGLSLAAIVAGGIGNMIDRILYGYVVDFVDFTLINFAVFNVADIFVTVGAFALAASMLLPLFLGKKKEEEKTK